MAYNKNVFSNVTQSGIIWALCITLIEIFQITTNASIRFLGPFDVLWISVVLFISYSIIWVCFLLIAAFIFNIFSKGRSGSIANIRLFYWCVAFFAYELFWVLFKIRVEKLYSSFYGIFLSMVLVVLSVLVAYAIYQIVEKLTRKGHLKHLVYQIIAFSISLTAYMTTYVYLKSLTNDGRINIFYAILLFLIFLIIFELIFLILKKIGSIYKNPKSSVGDGKTESVYLMTFLFAFVSVSLFVASSGITKNSEAVEKRNVILISIDTLRADHVSCYNERKKNTSPNIDKIARSGYIFKNAYSTTSWTLPGHASMMTGLFPSSHGADRSLNQSVGNPIDPLTQSKTTLAEVLGDKGYLTAGFISVPYLSSSFGMNQGFQFYDEKIDLFENVSLMSVNEYSMLFNLLRFLKVISPDDYDGDRGAPEINEHALSWLARNKDKDNPFFLFLHYFEPHFIYKPPPPYNISEDGRDLEYFTDIETLNRGQFSLSSYGLKDLITLYDGEIRYLDYQLGLLFSQIDKWNLLDNTVLIITSDHGESFNEHEVWTHGNRLYQEQIRVPLIIHYPKLVPVGYIDEDHIVQLVDIMPSILDFVGIPIPENVQGRSFFPVLKDQKEIKFDFAFAELRPDITWKGKNRRFGGGIKTVINKEWKYILYDNGDEELFNIGLDPKEEANMAPSKSEKIKEMKSILDLWSESVNQQKDEKQYLIDRGRLEQLRSLGYLK